MGDARGTAGALDVAGVVILTLVGVLSAIVECLLVPLYVGAVVFPLAVVLAVVLNLVLPRLAHALVPRTIVAAAPFAGWLAVVLTFGAVARPEGDVILPGGGPGHVVLVTYGVMFGGALAGGVALVALSGRQSRSGEALGYQSRSGVNPGGGSRR